ncbi:MAG: hypothetical protein QJR01_05325 [Kyrpidia sp.]|nr:hypothetical protein [Kyrpidia sp.]
MSDAVPSTTAADRIVEVLAFEKDPDGFPEVYGQDDIVRSTIFEDLEISLRDVWIAPLP